MKSRYSVSSTTRTDQKEPGLQFPVKVFLYMTLMSISVMFVGFSGAFLYTHFQNNLPGFRLPLIFHINTLVIIASSLVLQEGVIAMQNDESDKFRNIFGITFLLGIAFLVCQFFGWRALMHNGITLNNDQSASYLYLVSGLHALHVLGGVVALGYCFVQALLRVNNPVADLLFVCNPEKKMRVKLVATYWHFVDGLWIYLYIFFLLMLI